MITLLSNFVSFGAVVFEKNAQCRQHNRKFDALFSVTDFDVSWSQHNFLMNAKIIWGERSFTESCIKLVWKIPDWTFFFEGRISSSKIFEWWYECGSSESFILINEDPRLNKEMVAQTELECHGHDLSDGFHKHFTWPSKQRHAFISP